MITGVCLFSVAVGLRSAQATTVVIKLESKRIILADRYSWERLGRVFESDDQTCIPR